MSKSSANELHDKLVRAVNDLGTKMVILSEFTEPEFNISGASFIRPFTDIQEEALLLDRLEILIKHRRGALEIERRRRNYEQLLAQRRREEEARRRAEAARRPTNPPNPFS